MARAKLTAFDKHEALDRSYLLARFVDETLSGHKAIKADKSAQEFLDVAVRI